MSTTIKISTSTRERLKTIKLVKMETYDEIINRLLDLFQKPKSETERPKKRLTSKKNLPKK